MTSLHSKQSSGNGWLLGGDAYHFSGADMDICVQWKQGTFLLMWLFLMDLSWESLVMKFQHLPAMFTCQKKDTDIQDTYHCQTALQGHVAV